MANEETFELPERESKILAGMAAKQFAELVSRAASVGFEVALKQRARLVREEFVCCDIYQRMEDALDSQRCITQAWRDLRGSGAYHEVCYYGEWAARIVETGRYGHE